MDKDLWKEYSPATVLVWAAYIVGVLVTNFVKPMIDIPFTTLKLVPAMTLVFLVAGLVLTIIDFTRIMKKDKQGKEDSKQTDTK